MSASLCLSCVFLWSREMNKKLRDERDAFEAKKLVSLRKKILIPNHPPFICCCCCRHLGACHFHGWQWPELTRPGVVLNTDFTASLCPCWRQALLVAVANCPGLTQGALACDNHADPCMAAVGAACCTHGVCASWQALGTCKEGSEAGCIPGAGWWGRRWIPRCAAGWLGLEGHRKVLEFFWPLEFVADVLRCSSGAAPIPVNSAGVEVQQWALCQRARRKQGASDIWNSQCHLWPFLVSKISTNMWSFFNSYYFFTEKSLCSQMSLARLLCALLGPIPATTSLCLFCHHGPLEDL